MILGRNFGRWWQFTRERFDPLSHLLMILVFVQAHRALVGPESAGGGLVFALLFIGTAIFFFKLRLYDEIKDYELDCLINPGRPLVRGLLLHRDLYWGIGACIALELLLFAAVGAPAVGAILIPIGYSLLMYREFFIPRLIRPHLTTYAASHTVVSGMLSLALSAALSGRSGGQSIWAPGRSEWLFALNAWCLFNIFEFGRKTFTTVEERGGVESYSKIFGRVGAVVLVLSQAAVSAACLTRLGAHALYGQQNLLTALLVSVNGLLVLSGAAFIVLDRAPYGKVYRAFSSVYIVLIYLGYVGIRAC